jgi:RNA 2',3'-cyclic 3'-phosphodiesterase
VSPWQRHFLALVPDAAARAALSGIPVPDGARRTLPEDLHVTLAWLGTLDEAGEAACRGVANSVARHSERFEVAFDCLEVWPEPRVLCATQRRPSAALVGLVAALGQGLAREAGFVLEERPRPYRPHVTLARGVGGGEAAEALPVPVRWVAGTVVLMGSRVAGPPGYGVIDRAALGGS